MQIQFNGVTAECGQILLRYIIPMIDNMKLWMIRVEPLGKMSPRYKVHFANPRTERFNASEPILQVIPVPISVFTVVFFLGPLYAFFSFLHAGSFPSTQMITKSIRFFSLKSPVNFIFSTPSY